MVSLCCDLGWSDSDNFLFDKRKEEEIEVVGEDLKVS